MSNSLWNNIKPQDPQPLWCSNYGSGYNCKGQFENYKQLYNEKILNILTYFKNYSLFNSKVYNSFAEFKNDSNRKNYSTVYLKQSDFDNGTVRLRWPAYYVLSENITFNPNPGLLSEGGDDWMPTAEQMSGGASAEYPGMPYGPYDLGFFAAITVESTNIILNLNGKILRQSKQHHIQQRFYANIELASTPFIPTQGPANFGDSIVSANNCWITNGSLGLSSHHGIHGNGMKNCIIENLNIFDHEVGAISLNGGENIVTRNVHATNILNYIPIISTYSQCRFIRSFLRKLTLVSPEPSITFGNGVTKTATQALEDVNTELDSAFNKIMDNEDLDSSSLFYNKDKLSDCDCYGFLFNSLGVAVNDFKVNRDGAVGNINIIIHDCTIKNLATTAEEVICISNSQGESDEIQAYGKGQQVGPVGDVFAVAKVIDESGVYSNGNVLSNAQLLLAKYKNAGGSESMGTTNITPEIVSWAESTTSIYDIVSKGMEEDKYYFINGKDSMAHVMKGNIGVFLSAIKNCTVDSVKIETVENNGLEGSTNFGNILNDGKYYEGACNRSFGVFGSDGVIISNSTVNGCDSKNGCSFGIDVGTQSKNVSIFRLAINGIKSMPGSKELIDLSFKNPNHISQPFICRVGPDTQNVRINN